MIKKISLLVLMGLVIWIITGYVSALYLTSRREAASENKNTLLNKENIELITKDKIKISAWYIPGDSDKAVIILPGISADRSSCISRAELYHQLGFAVLLPDLRATGKSEGDIISFGWNESKDLLACYNYLIKKGFKKIAGHGCSLGAATIVYSLKDIKDYHFIILESCYDNLNHAFENRVKKFHVPNILFLPVKTFVKQRIGMDPDSLNPEEFIKLAECPALIMAGDTESQIPMYETKKIFANCKSTNKKLHIFHGGKHEDFMNKYNSEYKKITTEFISNF